MYLLHLNGRRPLLVASGNQQIDEAPVVLNACKFAAAAQDQRLGNRGLQMPVLRFHRSVLMGLTAIVAAGVHAVMTDKGIIAFGHILALIGSQVAECGRQAVGAVVLRHAAKRPKRLLQVLGQGREAFSAENYADMFPAAVDHDEVIEQVRERLPCDRHAQLVSMVEVGLAHISRLGRLAEDDVALGTVQRPPLTHPPLQGAPDTIIGERQWMRALKVAQQGDRLQRAVLHQQGKKVVLPIVFKGIGNRAPVDDLAM